MIPTYASQFYGVLNPVLTIAPIIIERYIAISHPPLKYSRFVTTRRTLLVIAIGWVLIVLQFIVGVQKYIYIPGLTHAFND